MGAGACRDQSSALLVEDFLAGPNNQGSTPESLDAYFYPFAVRSNEIDGRANPDQTAGRQRRNEVTVLTRDVNRITPSRRT